MNIFIDLLIFLHVMKPRVVRFDDKVQAELGDTRFAILTRERQLEDAQCELQALRKREQRLLGYVVRDVGVDSKNQEPVVERRLRRVKS